LNSFLIASTNESGSPLNTRDDDDDSDDVDDIEFDDDIELDDEEADGSDDDDEVAEGHSEARLGLTEGRLTVEEVMVGAKKPFLRPFSSFLICTNFRAKCFG
jgi:hypothetical protein